MGGDVGTRFARLGAMALVGVMGLGAAPAQADQVINDDLIVIGSQCLGIDCVNGEDFGADTLRLKENNLRIAVTDTSNTAGFPSNDWKLIFNDQASGGGNYFGVHDADLGRTSFRVDAGAPVDALRVSPSGKVGIGTGAPAVEVHVDDSDTPTLRLQQNNDGGWGAFTWDVAGNETNWFVRDVTNGSLLPLKIRPGVQTNGIDLRKSGPQIRGALQQNVKTADIENEQPVDPAAIMTGLRGLTLTTGEFKADDTNQVHLWPTADAFTSAFGLGIADFVTPTDMAGVALIAAKDLDARLTTLESAGGGAGPAGPAGPPGPQGPAGTPGTGEPASTEVLTKLQKKVRRQNRKLKRLKKSHRKLAKRVKAIERGR